MWLHTTKKDIVMGPYSSGHDRTESLILSSSPVGQLMRPRMFPGFVVWSPQAFASVELRRTAPCLDQFSFWLNWLLDLKFQKRWCCILKYFEGLVDPKEIRASEESWSGTILTTRGIAWGAQLKEEWGVEWSAESSEANSEATFVQVTKLHQLQILFTCYPQASTSSEVSPDYPDPHCQLALTCSAWRYLYEQKQDLEVRICALRESFIPSILSNGQNWSMGNGRANIPASRMLLAAGNPVETQSKEDLDGVSSGKQNEEFSTALLPYILLFPPTLQQYFNVPHHLDIKTQFISISLLCRPAGSTYGVVVWSLHAWSPMTRSMSWPLKWCKAQAETWFKDMGWVACSRTSLHNCPMLGRQVFAGPWPGCRPQIGTGVVLH